MYMYQGLGQMLTIRLQHHQGCSETPKCAYVIYGQPPRLSTKKKRSPSGKMAAAEAGVAGAKVVVDVATGEINKWAEGKLEKLRSITTGATTVYVNPNMVAIDQSPGGKS